MSRDYDIEDILAEIKAKKMEAGVNTPPPQSDGVFTPAQTPANDSPHQVPLPQTSELFQQEEVAYQPDSPLGSPFDDENFTPDAPQNRSVGVNNKKPGKFSIRHDSVPQTTAPFLIADPSLNVASETPKPPPISKFVSDIQAYRSEYTPKPSARPSAAPPDYSKIPPLPVESKYAEQPSDNTRVIPNIRDIPPDNNAGIFGAESLISTPPANRDSQNSRSKHTPEYTADVIDFGEYNSPKDNAVVARDLARTKAWLHLRIFLSAILVFFQIWFALSAKYESLPMPLLFWPEPETMQTYLIGCTALCILLTFVNSSAVGGGIAALITFKANADSLPAVAILAAISQCVIGITNPNAVFPDRLTLYFPLAGIAILFGALSKLGTMTRIQNNFAMLSSPGDKRAVMLVNNSAVYSDLFPAAKRKPNIAYTVSADFFTNFLALSYSDKQNAGIYASMAPACLFGAVVASGVAYFLLKDMTQALCVFVAVLCVAAAFSAGFNESVPLKKLSSRLLPLGCMVAGSQSVKDFSALDALILSDNDIFPAGSITLKSIKDFSQGRIDQAIIDAASVICSLDSALSPIFLQMIGGDESLLKKADSIVFENGMGISAWVDSRRVLIGNHKLMLNHGIPMPSVDPFISSDPDCAVIFISSAGEMSALFNFRYAKNPKLAAALDRFADLDKMLIINTSDPNISSARISNLYQYPQNLIEIISSKQHERFNVLAEHRKNAPAEIVYTGSSAALIAALSASSRAHGSIVLSSAIELFQIIFGFTLLSFFAFLGSATSITFLHITAYQLAFFFLQSLISRARRV